MRNNLGIQASHFHEYFRKIMHEPERKQISNTAPLLNNKKSVVSLHISYFEPSLYMNWLLWRRTCIRGVCIMHVINFLHIHKSCFLFFPHFILLMMERQFVLYRVAQKECNTSDQIISRKRETECKSCVHYCL